MNTHKRVYNLILMTAISLGASFGGANVQKTEDAASEQTKSTTKIKTPMQIVPEIGNNTFHLVGAATNTNYKSGMMVGAVARFATENERLSWGLGARYFQAGFQQGDFWGILPKMDITADYFGIPLTAEYLISDPASEGTHYFATGGMIGSYLLGATQKVSWLGKSDESGIRSDLNSTSVIANLGIGGRYMTAVGQLELVVDYHRGLSNFGKSESGKLEGLQAKLGYTVNL